MLVRSCRAYHFRTLIADKQSGTDNRNPGRATELVKACEREQTARAQLVECQKAFGMGKGAKFFGLKTPSAQIPTGCTCTL